MMNFTETMNPDDLYRDAIHHARGALYKLGKEIGKHVTKQKDDPDNYTYAGDMIRLSDKLEQVVWQRERR